jgi:hypothetical protein
MYFLPCRGQKKRHPFSMSQSKLDIYLNVGMEALATKHLRISQAFEKATFESTRD